MDTKLYKTIQISLQRRASGQMKRNATYIRLTEKIVVGWGDIKPGFMNARPSSSV